MPFMETEPTTDDLDRVTFSIKDLRDYLEIFEREVDVNDRLPLGEWISTLRESARNIVA